MKPLKYISNNSSSDKLLLCLHGNSADNKYFLEILNIFNDWKVIAPDFLGHGESPRLEPKDYNVTNFIQCLIDVLEKESYKELVIIGHSFGGNMAIELLSKVKIDGILLMASAPLTYTINEAPYLQIPELILTDNPAQNELLIDAFLTTFSTFPTTTNYLKGTFANTDPVFRDRLFEELYAMAFSDQLLILEAHPKTKIYLLNGSDDEVINRTFLERLVLEGKLPQNQIIENTGHFLLLDEPDLCISKIKVFVDSFN